jgi:hypothetical protein
MIYVHENGWSHFGTAYSVETLPHWQEFLSEVKAAIYAGEQSDGATAKALAKRWMYMLAEDDLSLEFGQGLEPPTDPALNAFLSRARELIHKEAFWRNQRAKSQAAPPSQHLGPA